MKSQINKIKAKIRNFVVSILTAGLLFSCGDSATTFIVASVIDAGVGGTGIVRGIITGFGSVYVNGIKFEIDESNTVFDVDGNLQSNQSDLSIGMFVTIKGTINEDGVTGIAESLTYDDDIEGPINSAPTFVTGSDNQQKQLSILGYTITVDALATHYDNTSFNALAINDVVEISGFRSTSDTLVATLVKKTNVFVENATEVELKGVIENLSAVSFNLNSIIIHYSTATELELDVSELSNGIFVEVEGILQSDGSINADEIEQEGNEFSEEDGGISLSGIISDYIDSSSFKINGQLIDASSAQEFSPDNALSLLQNSVSVEVEGSIVNSVLIAEEIEVKLKNIKISALVNSVSNNSFSVSYNNIEGVINIQVNSQTQFKDESEAEIKLLKLSDIVPTDYVEIEATLVDGQIVATNVQRGEQEDFILQGPLDSTISNTSVTVLEVTYAVDDDTDYDGFDGALEFFNTISQGEVIRIKDENADGIAEKIKLGS